MWNGCTFTETFLSHIVCLSFEKVSNSFLKGKQKMALAPRIKKKSKYSLFSMDIILDLPWGVENMKG